MPSDREREPTRLLLRMSEGDPAAAAKLLPILYDELHRMAVLLMKDERTGHTLQPTALVNEAWLRLAGGEGARPSDRIQFLRLAARAMRNVLVDHARARNAEKRGSGRRKVTLDEGIPLGGDAELLLLVDDALSRLAGIDAQLAQVVELRFFGGLTEAEIAVALGVSVRTVERAWRTARAWLGREMSGQ